MAFAFTQSATAQDDASDNSVAVSLTGVAAGALVVLFAKWEDAAATMTINDGTSDATIYGTYNDHSSVNLHTGMGYYLSANSGNRTYTCTLSGARAFKWLYALEFSYSGVCSLDQADATAEGNGFSVASGAITTTGTDEAVIGFLGKFNSESYSAETIGGVSADGAIGTEPSAAHAWYRILTATMSGGTAAATADNTFEWVCSIISFKAIPGAPTIITQPQDLAVIFSNPAAFTVEASSATGTTLSYQWTQNGSNVGSNASSYSTSQTIAADQNARFAVSVWDVNGTTQSDNAYLRLTFSSGAYAQEIADRYLLESPSGVYLIEPWGAAVTSTTFGPFFVGALNGLGSGGRFHKNRLH